MKISNLSTTHSANLQILLGLALISEFLYLTIAALGDLRTQIPLYLLCYAALFLVYCVAVIFLFTYDRNRRTTQTGSLRKPFAWLGEFVSQRRIREYLTRKEVLVVGLVFGVLFRITLLSSTPSLSDDIYRYIWDGKVSSNGFNPFEFAPEAEELASLRDSEIYPFINHKEIATVYPPVSQFVFSVLYRLSGTVTGFKAGLLVLDLLTIVMLFFILRRLALSPNRLLIYTWNPLIVMEFSHSGHFDIIGILFLVLALALLVSARSVWSTVALGFSFLTKFVTLLLLPILTLARKEGKMVVPLVFLILSALLYLPYVEIGTGLFSGLLVYSDKWAFNNSLFSVVDAGIKPLLASQWFAETSVAWSGTLGLVPDWGTRDPNLSLIFAKGLIVILFAGVLLYFAVRFKKDLQVYGKIWYFKAGIILLGTFILLNPTVHPWYLAWLVPFLVVVPNRAWLLLTGLSGLSYWILVDYSQTGVWQESTWVRLVEYLPFYTLLLYDALRRRASWGPVKSIFRLS